MNRTRKIKRALLRLIIAADKAGYASSDVQLASDMLESGIHPSPGIAELRDALTQMDRDGLVITVPDEELSRFTPTPKGHAELLKPV